VAGFDPFPYSSAKEYRETMGIRLLDNDFCVVKLKNNGTLTVKAKPRYQGTIMHARDSRVLEATELPRLVGALIAKQLANAFDITTLEDGEYKVEFDPNESGRGQLVFATGGGIRFINFENPAELEEVIQQLRENGEVTREHGKIANDADNRVGAK
jgi:hypothetical protein